MEAGEDLNDLDVAEIDAVLGALAAVCSDLVVAAAVGNVSLDDGDGESPIADLASVSVGVRQRRSALFNGSVLVTLSSHASAIALEQVVALGDLPPALWRKRRAASKFGAGWRAVRVACFRGRWLGRADHDAQRSAGRGDVQRRRHERPWSKRRWMATR